MPLIRPSRDEDLPALTAIYEHHVLHGTATFELVPPTVAEMAQRRADVLAKGLPYLVCTEGEQVLGYAYANWFKPRPAYRFMAEHSIYLAHDAGRRGLGRLLLAELATQCEARGIRKLVAVIGGSDNLASIGLHRSLGFQDCGLIRNAGWKHGRWLDTIMMDKVLGAGGSTQPE
ncbi:MAG: L-methionine sulfoximine/L-methionine sulfone acetyltransferase [Paracidovorax wautersii]|uniref:L-methionine sulfoximine/L-methionine sulfone acetyltransferase n=1 Tax=Paracidovorax wautersii TaxID=1177982 RepID=A0A7V8JR84_9BURK|nr:MAG: L-methionine sulfoximine/L-methionine sulfone acetyltransferase [Paracidovorax wautersii]